MRGSGPLGSSGLLKREADEEPNEKSSLSWVNGSNFSGSVSKVNGLKLSALVVKVGCSVGLSDACTNSEHIVIVTKAMMKIVGRLSSFRDG